VSTDTKDFITEFKRALGELDASVEAARATLEDLKSEVESLKALASQAVSADSPKGWTYNPQPGVGQGTRAYQHQPGSDPTPEK